jgi:tetratricopeptide (TPR) repeat protein
MNRKLAVASAALFLTWTCAGHAEPTALLAEGDAALARFELEPALRSYRAAVELDPRSYEAQWKLARSLADHAMLETDAAKQKPTYLEAQSHARTAVSLNQKDSKGHIFVAIIVGKLALYYGGRTKVELSKEVKTEAEQALALNPKEDLAYHVLGVWNREMAELNWMLRTVAEVLYGRFPPASRDEALKDLRHAAELMPAAVAHRVELGITLASARQWLEAAQTLEGALQMPQTWVTDASYKERARLMLERVKRQLR